MVFGTCTFLILRSFPASWKALWSISGLLWASLWLSRTSLEALCGLPTVPWGLIITRQTPSIVTLKLLKTSLRLSWSLFGALGDLHNLQLCCPELFRRGFLRFWPLHNSFWALKLRSWAPVTALRALQPLSNKAPLAIDLVSLLNKWATKHTTQLSHSAAKWLK